MPNGRAPGMQTNTHKQLKWIDKGNLCQRPSAHIKSRRTPSYRPAVTACARVSMSVWPFHLPAVTVDLGHYLESGVRHSHNSAVCWVACVHARAHGHMSAYTQAHPLIFSYWWNCDCCSEVQSDTLGWTLRSARGSCTVQSEEEEVCQRGALSEERWAFCVC